MKSCLLSLLIFLGLMYFIGSLFANSTFSKIDSCLDSGGCWDDIRNRCEYKNQGMCVILFDIYNNILNTIFS